MKFSHKIVAASSLLFLATVSLLTLQQYYTVQKEVKSLVTSSVAEIVDGVRDTTEAETIAQDIANYATSMLEANLTPSAMEMVITRPIVKKPLLAGLGFEKDGSNINNDPVEPRLHMGSSRQTLVYRRQEIRRAYHNSPYADSATGEILVSIATPAMDGSEFIGAIFYDVSLAGLAELVNKVQLFNAGYVFIVSGDGTTIAHPNTK